MSWCSKKQSVIALSNCEAKYVAGVVAACQTNWLQTLLNKLMIKIEEPIKLQIDNKSTISLAKNSVSRGKSKHI